MLVFKSSEVRFEIFSIQNYRIYNGLLCRCMGAVNTTRRVRAKANDGSHKKDSPEVVSNLRWQICEWDRGDIVKDAIFKSCKIA